MKFRIHTILILGVLVALAGLATGQMTGQVDNINLAKFEPAVDWVARLESLITVWLPRLVIVCTMITAALPSTGKIMRVIDIFAGSWGKARNDPAAQKWGK